ncbi:hypothetical protein ABBQ32_013589 [Trebouxia sp. C0010 RCD-2024]
MVTSCPQCSAGLAEYDSEAGANFCQSCGFQVSVEELCSEVERNPDGQQYGTFVAANGRVAGGCGRDGHFTPGGNTKQAVPDKAFKEIQGQAERLGIMEPVKGDATFYLETAYPMLITRGGRFTTDTVAAACLYAAVRHKNMPISIAEMATAIGKPRHTVGAAYIALLRVLGLRMPAFVDFSKYIQRHIAQLPPLRNSTKQASVMSSFEKLMQWALKNEAVLAGNTSSLAAAALLLVTQAYQIKLTPEAVAAVFTAKRTTMSKHVLEIRTALVAAAQLVPWLQDIDRSNVTSHLRVIIEVANAVGSAQAEQVAQADIGDNTSPASPDQSTALESGVSAGIAEAPVLAEHIQQPGITQKVYLSRKRRRCEGQADAAYNNSLAVSVQPPQRGSAFVVPDLDSKQFAEETVIKEHEWPQYIHMPKRLRCSTGSHAKKALHADIPAC